MKKVYTYDSLDRVKEMTYTDLETGKVMESYQYSYDKNSNITEKTQVNNYPKEDADKVNETKVYTYDTLGRLTKTVTTDHKKDDKTKTVTYTYDNVGNRLKEDDGTTTTSYTYNGLDQLKTSTKEKGTAVEEVRQYDYDANGNQTDVILPSKEPVRRPALLLSSYAFIYIYAFIPRLAAAPKTAFDSGNL